MAAAGARESEKVLVVRRELLPFGSGLRTEHIGDHLRACDNGHWMARDLAEKDERFLQVIPYVVLRRGPEVFVYERAGSEGRLTGLLSLGIGGHVNENDGTWERGMVRELMEEAGVSGSPVRAGVLFDPSSPVGRVHLGLLHTLEVQGEVRFSEGKAPRWHLAADLRKMEGRFENWSRLVIERMF